MGTPGRKDDVVGFGRDADIDLEDYDDLEGENEEEDPEEEDFEEDPEEEEEEEVAVGVETVESEEEGVHDDEELQEEEEEVEEEEGDEENEVDELEEKEEVEEVVQDDKEEVMNEGEEDEEEYGVELENNDEDVENEDEAEEDEEEDGVGLENNEEDVENKDEGEEDGEEDGVELENGDEVVENENEAEEEEELELGNNEEDVENENEAEEDDELELENSEEDVNHEDDAEEDEVELKNNEENGENGDEMEEDFKSSIPPSISSKKEASDILAGEQQNGFKGDTDVPGNESEHTGDIDPFIFTIEEALKNENIVCGHEAEGVNVMESDCRNKLNSQHVNERDAKDIDLHAMRGESEGSEATERFNTNTLILVESGANKCDQVEHRSEGDGVKEKEFNEERIFFQHISDIDADNIDMCARLSEPKGIEASEFRSINPPISLEAEPVRNEKLDLASKCMGVKRMDSECEEKERQFNKKVAESIDVYAPSSELKDTAEIGKHLSSTWLDSELVLQEGGVEDMDLDSEENIVLGAVVDSIQENTALNCHHNTSFSAGAYALYNKADARNIMSVSSGGKDTTHNHELKLSGGNSMILDLKEHTAPEPSSMAATLGKQRNLHHVTQDADSNKRAAIQCSYYAKGWCIKGTLCRFLHVKENNDSSFKQQERGLASENGEKQVSEGIGDNSKIIFQEKRAENHMQQLNNTLHYPPLESRLLHSAKPDFGFGVVASSFASKLTPPIVNAALFSDPLQSIANRYINQHLHPTALTDVYSSRYISPANESSNSVVSLKPTPYDSHKILSGSRDFNASSSSLGLRYELDRLNSLGLPPKAEMYKWEPSKPFRPSYYFSIPSGSSPGNMYDPLRDSIEHTSMGVESFKAEPINYPSNQSYPDSVANNFEMDGYNGTLPDKYRHSRVTGVLVAEEEAAESSVADQGNLGSALGGDRGSGTSHGKYLSETNKTNSVSAEKKSKLLEEKIHSNGVDVERGLATNDQGESKTFRQFRVALIEFTKELLKPVWRVGKMSKDVHNLIVKKTVTKVLSSLHSNQVPSTPDLVQQYLSGSQPKITKLLEAYVQKHSKT